MSILSELFGKAGIAWDATNRLQLSDAVKRLTDQAGGIRGLSRQLNIPLTSLNRGIATSLPHHVQAHWIVCKPQSPTLAYSSLHRASIPPRWT